MNTPPYSASRSEPSLKKNYFPDEPLSLRQGNRSFLTWAIPAAASSQWI
jgi:hypothetical protein